MDKRFDGVYRRLDEMSLFERDLFEGFSYSLLKKVLESQGIDTIPERRAHFKDEAMVVHPDSTDIEVDLFSARIPFMGEVTRKVESIEKVEVFVRKIRFIEPMLDFIPSSERRSINSEIVIPAKYAAFPIEHVPYI